MSKKREVILRYPGGREFDANSVGLPKVGEDILLWSGAGWNEWRVTWRGVRLAGGKVMEIVEIGKPDKEALRKVYLVGAHQERNVL